MDAVIDHALFQVYVDGNALPEAALNSLLEIRIQQRLSQPALCEVYFLDAYIVQDNLSIGVPGKTLEVGLVGNSKMIFIGEITAVEYQYSSEGETSIFVRAYDFMHRLRTGPNSDSFGEYALNQVVNQIARRDGVKVRWPGGENKNHFAWPMLIQYNQSDLDFLVEQAYRLGFYFTAKGDTLQALTLAGLSEEPFLVAYGGNLRQANLEINQGKAFREVRLEGWNIERAEPIFVRVGKPGFERSVDPVNPKRLNSNLPGIQLRNQVLVNENHARALAQAELDRCYSSCWTLRGLADGSPELYPGRRILVEGVAPDAVGYYVLTEVTHIYNQNGYTSELSTALLELIQRPQAGTMTLGQVVDVADPLRIGRVRVALSALIKDLVIWLPAALPGVGENHGFAISPHIGDHVLVLVMTDNPGMGVVLGGLYGTKRPPEEWTNLSDPGAKTYSWVTPGSQKIQLRDGLTSAAIRLQVGGGAYIELDGQNITIAGGKINFERL